MLLLTPSVSGLFKWRQCEPEVILLAVGWYLRFSLSYRDVEELLAERGLLVDHVTVCRRYSVTPQKWNDVCARASNRPTTVGGPRWPAFEVIYMIRKDQACGSAPTRVGLLHRFIVGMFGIEVCNCIRFQSCTTTDSTGATIDFLLSAKRDAAAAERFLTKALGGENHPAPRVINTDKHAAYPQAIAELKADGVLDLD